MNAVPSVRRRLTGSALRRYRESLGYHLDDAARILGCDSSKISRIETGARGIRLAELRLLLAEYGAGQRAQDALTAVAAPYGWWREFKGTLPEPFLDYLVLEASASRILTYEAHQVPALLQTPAYAQALAQSASAVPEEARNAAGALVAARRKAVLDSSQTEVHAVIGEAALRPGTGDHDVMNDQLRRLDAEASRIPVQILPLNATPHPAPWAGSLTVLEFTGIPGLPGVARLGGPNGGIFLDDEPGLAACARVFTDLTALALNPDESRQQIRGVIPA
jgi:transcriptional regulator with XRE-family HTH domain